MWHFISIGWVEVNVRAQFIYFIEGKSPSRLKCLNGSLEEFPQGKVLLFYYYRKPWKKNCLWLVRDLPSKYIQIFQNYHTFLYSYNYKNQFEMGMPRLSNIFSKLFLSLCNFEQLIYILSLNLIPPSRISKYVLDSIFCIEF